MSLARAASLNCTSGPPPCRCSGSFGPTRVLPGRLHPDDSALCRLSARARPVDRTVRRPCGTARGGSRGRPLSRARCLRAPSVPLPGEPLYHPVRAPRPHRRHARGVDGAWPAEFDEPGLHGERRSRTCSRRNRWSSRRAAIDGDALLTVGIAVDLLSSGLVRDPMALASSPRLRDGASSLRERDTVAR